VEEQSTQRSWAIEESSQNIDRTDRGYTTKEKAPQIPG
jgi:hypothetical protein